MEESKFDLTKQILLASKPQNLQRLAYALGLKIDNLRHRNIVRLVWLTTRVAVKK